MDRLEFQKLCPNSPSPESDTGFLPSRIGGRGKRTNSSGFDHVADGKSLYRLVLGCASRAVAASDGLDVAAALLVTSAVIALSAFNPPRFRYLYNWRAPGSGLISRAREMVPPIIYFGGVFVLGRALLDHDCGFWEKDISR